jgi:hypothetical protein
VLGDRRRRRTVGGTRSAAGTLSVAGLLACAGLGGLVADAVWANPIPPVLVDVVLLSAVVAALAAAAVERKASVRREAMRERADKRLMSCGEHSSGSGRDARNVSPHRE